MLRVGLTGGIASGKSHVLRRLAQRGLGVLDLDAVAHAATAPGGAAYDDVVAAFGPGILAADGTIDRKALGAVVFADPAARARLDALVHPRVRAEERRLAGALAEEGRTVLVTDAALLVEAGAHLRFERLVVVHCSPEEQLGRLMQRDGLTEEAARARIAAQMPVADKRQFAHALVDTGGSVAETEEAADRLADELAALAHRPTLYHRIDASALEAALACGGDRGPRGLTPLQLLDDALAAGGLELLRLRARLAPAAAGPWYRAARAGEGAPWPEALAVPLAVWAVLRGHDDEWLAAAAASLARLTHAEPGQVGAAVLAALAAHAVARGEGPGTLPERVSGWARTAARWGGAVDVARVATAIAAAAVSHRACQEASRDAEAHGAEPAFAGGLVGVASGRAPRDSVTPAMRELARRLANG